MRNFLLSIIIFVMLSTFAIAQESEESSSTSSTNTQDNSVVYEIDYNAGNDSLLVIGNNTIHLPADSNDTESPANEITYSEDRESFVLVMNKTDFFFEGVKTRYTKLVFELKADGWEVLWTEQGK